MSLPCRRLGITISYRFRSWYRVLTGWTTNWTGCKESWSAAVVQKDEKKKVQRKLDLARVDFKEALGAPEVIRKFLPTSVRKLLVFCRDLTDLKQMVPEVCGWLTRAGRAITPFEIHHAQGERQNGRILDAFREESDRLHVLFSVNMLIEGLHVEGVDAVLFLRRTESYIVTLQQLGRCLDAGGRKTAGRLGFRQQSFRKISL